MSGRVQVTGLTELIQAITDAPTEIRAEAMGIVREATESAAKDIAASYPRVTGTLARRVQTIYPSEQIAIGVVRSTAPHSHLFEFGTRQRQTASGANRGRMPAEAVTVPIARRHRDRMFGRLVGMLRDRGYEVTGA